MRHALRTSAALLALMAAPSAAAAFYCHPHKVVFVHGASGRTFTTTAYGTGTQVDRTNPAPRVTALHVWEGRMGERLAYLSLERVASREGYASGGFERPVLDVELSWAPRRDVMRWVDGDAPAVRPRSTVLNIPHGPLKGAWEARDCAP